MERRAVARQTEIDALEPKPEPIGIEERRRKVMSELRGFESEMKR